MIERNHYLSKLQRRLENYPVTGLIGPRQVGKTTLVKQLTSTGKAAYVDLESDLDQAKLIDPGLFFRSNANRCIILDEIQNRQDLFGLLRSIVDEDRRPGRFVLLGSASPSLMRKSADSLAGRIAYEEISPFSLEELGQAAQTSLWVKGGFPRAYLAKTSEGSYDWRRQFVKTYVDRDLPALGLDTNPKTLNNFLRMLAASTGQLWNAATFAKSLGVTAPTVRKYLNFLEQAFLITVLEPYHANIKKRLVKTPKVFFNDTGLLHAMLHLPDYDFLSGNPIIGSSWENFAVRQIMQTLGNRYEYHFYRTHEGAEIDLLLLENNKPSIAIEIKYSNAPKLTKGYLNAIGDVGTRRNFVVTPSSDYFPVHAKVEVINLGDLIKKLSEK
ncbi:MAG: ATP-binding protein [Bacteroidota bacterium]